MELLEEIEERYIEVNGVKLHTVIVGKGEPIILLHGFYDFWYSWKDVMIALKDEYKLIVPDTRGINTSEKPEGVDNYYPEVLINDVKVLAEVLELGKFILVGHDWGGSIALGFATMYPELLKKLIVLNTMHSGLLAKLIRTDKEFRSSASYQLDFIKKGSEDTLAPQDWESFNDNLLAKKDDFDKEMYLKAWKQPGALKAGLNYYRAAYKRAREGKNPEDWGGKIDVPTLVIWGKKDKVLRPILASGLEDFIPNIKIVWSEEAGHFILADDPKIVISS
ncbi:MAG: alpha/beta fold hydrolase, partial [Candidatus Heimdallarchaeota archaeon]